MGKTKKQTKKKPKKTNPQKHVSKIHNVEHDRIVHELIICGHSSESIGTFKLPKNIKIIFFANESEQCIVPDTHANLKSCVSEMRGINEQRNTYTDTNQCPNHIVTFNNSTTLDGISIIKNDFFSQHDINPFEQIFTLNKDITLEQCCKKMQSIYGPHQMLTIYCVFCRGSKQDSNYDSLIGVGNNNVFEQNLSDGFDINEVNDDFSIGMDNGIDQNGIHEFNSDDFALLESLDNGANGTKKILKRKKKTKKLRNIFKRLN